MPTGNFELIFLGDQQLLADRTAAANRPVGPVDRRFTIEHHPLAVACVAGQLNTANAHWVLRLLDRALQGCRDGEFDGMVTAPVQKSIINDAGVAFSGHTEYLAAACNVDTPVMLLIGGMLKVALATTHLPLRDVSASITADGLDHVLTILARDLTRLWGIGHPRIGVCGLNPHAGEGGHLGHEDAAIIAPAILRAQQRGIRATGPYPADTLFTPRLLEQFDAVLAMYHDQGLPVLKHAAFGHAVNVTLGLPIIRTSVDHGTALDLAGTGRADAGSLVAAVTLAAQLARSRLQFA